MIIKNGTDAQHVGVYLILKGVFKINKLLIAHGNQPLLVDMVTSQ
jgi:uncharacterized membrane protein HdeD (DUF308 family)